MCLAAWPSVSSSGADATTGASACSTGKAQVCFSSAEADGTGSASCSRGSDHDTAVASAVSATSAPSEVERVCQSSMQQRARSLKAINQERSCISGKTDPVCSDSSHHQQGSSWLGSGEECHVSDASEASGSDGVIDDADLPDALWLPQFGQRRLCASLHVT